MSLLIAPADLPAHPARAERRLLLVALCAAWCGTCRDFRPVLEQLASAHPDVAFAWADVEDDAEWVGDIDVESFPTLAVLDAGRPHYFGATPPLAASVEQLLRALRTATGPLSPIPEEVSDFATRLDAAVR